MAKFRDIVCKYYVCLGQCQKGRDACHRGYCQKCNKYNPRFREKSINEKRKKLENIRRKEA